MTTKSLELFDQIAITGRFQEYNPDFVTAADKTAPLVEPGLASIDQVPLQFIMAADDMVCTTAQATDLINEIPAVAKSTTLVDSDHAYFYWNNDPTWTQQLANEIQACVTEDCKEKDTPWGWIFGGTLTGLILLMLIIVCCCCKKDKNN